MSSIKRFAFVHTIRFKLTLIYSLILFLLSSVLVLCLNVYLDSYLRTDPNLNRMPAFVPGLYSNVPDFGQLELQERTRIREIRLEDLQEIQELSIISLIPTALISFALGYFISGRFLSPIGELKEEIDRLRTKDLGKTLPVEVEDEVGGLIESFNDLSVRLKQAFDSQERFVQDASHELKTPLTIIQTNLDTILDDNNATPAELKTAITNALKGMKDLKNLTDYLLQLTISEQKSFQQIDLKTLIQKQVDLLGNFAKEQNVKLELNSQLPQLLVNADEIALGRAVFNIIENAIKYMDVKENSLVSISLEKNERSALIKIHDNGKGIPQAEQQKIFERFYRVEKSRSKKSGGFGLGLSITKKTIEEHQGKISVTSKPADTTFTITLPLV